MENILLSLVLFAVIFSFLCSLYCEYCYQNGIDLSVNKESFEQLNIIYPEDAIKFLDELDNDDELVFTEKEIPEFTPILAQEIEVNPQPVSVDKIDLIIEENPLPKLDKLNSKTLHKVAQQLGIKITYKLNGKRKTKIKEQLINDIQQVTNNDTEMKDNLAEIVTQLQAQTI